MYIHSDRIGVKEEQASINLMVPAHSATSCNVICNVA